MKNPATEVRAPLFTALLAFAVGCNGGSADAGGDSGVADGGAPETSAAACRNGVDDDRDGASDCADSDCAEFIFCTDAGPPPVPENTAAVCQNDEDDDRDGFTDCADPDCRSFVFCVPDGGSVQPENSEAACDDGVDNDRDGATDCDDLECIRFATVCPCPERLPVAGRAIRWPLPSSIQLGGGWNSLLTASAGNCIEPAATRTLDGDPAGRIENLRFYLIEEATLLREALSMSASASYSSGIYAADASASYARERHVSSYSTYLVLESTVRFPEQTLEAFRIRTPRLSDLARSPSAFVGTCGDQFVASVVRGGVFRVVFRFTGLSERDRREMSASLGGSAGTFSGSASATSTLDTLRSRYETSITVFRSGAVAAPFSGNLEDLMVEGLSFVEGVTPETAVPIEVSTLSYYNADNFPACAALPDYQDEFRTIEDLGRADDDARVVINDISTRVAMGGRLTEPSCDATLAEVEGRQAALSIYQMELRSAFDACTRALPDCALPPPPVPVAMPRIPQECGPTCATGDGAEYSFDSLGYCTRCEWRVPGPISVSHNATGFRNYCRFMRPSARAMVRLRANPVSVEGLNMGSNIFSWMHVFLGAEGEGAPSCAVPGSDTTCSFYRDRGFIYDLGTLTNRVRARAGEASGYIYAGRCTTYTDRWCYFSNVVMQVCDESADETIGCAPL